MEADREPDESPEDTTLVIEAGAEGQSHLVELEPQGAEEEMERKLHFFYRLLATGRQETSAQTAFPQALVNVILSDLHASQATRLELIGSKLPVRLNDDDVINLIGALIEANIQLQELHLLYHNITDVGLEEICRLLHPSLFPAAANAPQHRRRGLTVLDLTGNDIDGTALERTTLMSQYDCPLLTLNLSFNPLSPRGHGVVANMVAINQTLRRLLINSCGFNLYALNDLLSKLKENSTLETLSLDRPILANVQEGGIVEHFSKILPTNRTLAHLSLKNHHLYDHHAKMLASTLFVNNRMVSLNLEANSIGVIGVEALASCILAQQQRSLQYLGLSYNSVRNDGAIALADCLKGSATNLRVLTLKNCGIGPIGLKAIGAALESAANIEQIMLFGNHFDNDNGAQFADLIQHRLTYVDIHIDVTVYVVDGQYMIAEV